MVTSNVVPFQTARAIAAALVKRSEGCRLKAYRDSGGIWTIGYGHTKGVTEGMTCTQAQADAWLDEDMSEAERNVAALVKVPLTTCQTAALTDFAFNTGASQLAHSTLLRVINANHLDLAPGEFERWVYDNGKKMPGLVIRREREAFLWTLREGARIPPDFGVPDKPVKSASI